MPSDEEMEIRWVYFLLNFLKSVTNVLENILNEHYILHDFFMDINLCIFSERTNPYFL